MRTWFICSKRLFGFIESLFPVSASAGSGLHSACSTLQPSRPLCNFFFSFFIQEKIFPNFAFLFLCGSKLKRNYIRNINRACLLAFFRQVSGETTHSGHCETRELQAVGQTSLCPDWEDRGGQGQWSMPLLPCTDGSDNFAIVKQKYCRLKFLCCFILEFLNWLHATQNWA